MHAGGPGLLDLLVHRAVDVAVYGQQHFLRCVALRSHRSFNLRALNLEPLLLQGQEGSCERI